MVFIHDTRRALMAVVDLVNTLPGPDRADALRTLDDLDAYLDANPYTGSIERDERTVAQLRGVRARLRGLWDVDRAGAVPLVNAMLADGRALPRLVIHDGYDWHIHATTDETPLATRIMVEAAMAFVDVIRTDEYDRVRRRAAARAVRQASFNMRMGAPATGTRLRLRNATVRVLGVPPLRALLARAFTMRWL